MRYRQEKPSAAVGQQAVDTKKTCYTLSLKHTHTKHTHRLTHLLREHPEQTWTLFATHIQYMHARAHTHQQKLEEGKKKCQNTHGAYG